LINRNPTNHQKPQKDSPSIAAILGGLDGEEF
jgi:hypothetical protein